MSTKLIPPISECAAAVNCKIVHKSVYYKNPFGVHCVKLISQSLLKIEVKLGDIGIERIMNYKLLIWILLFYFFELT